MVISRTPFRISLFGGGTDYPVWYTEHGGRVLGMTIKHYGYVVCQPVQPFWAHQYVVRYSKVERVATVEEIEHPAVRVCLQYLNIPHGVEVTYSSDLPAMSGMGTSSAFTVGLLHALHGMRGEMVGAEDLALEALEIEQDVLKEAVGSQDQVWAAFGGLRVIDFGPGPNDLVVRPVLIPPARIRELEQHLMLVFTGIQRQASVVAAEQIAATPTKVRELSIMQQLVEAALQVLCRSKAPMVALGALLHESWELKRSLTPHISTPEIDAIYQRALRAGAAGGKLGGAGSGGFLLLCIPPEKREQVQWALTADPEHPPLICLPVEMEPTGSQIIHYEPQVARMAA